MDADSKLGKDLEALVDANSLNTVLETLAAVARAKAEHIRDNRQDSVTAKPWDKAAGAIEKILPNVTV